MDSTNRLDYVLGKLRVNLAEFSEDHLISILRTVFDELGPRAKYLHGLMKLRKLNFSSSSSLWTDNISCGRGLALKSQIWRICWIGDRELWGVNRHGVEVMTRETNYWLCLASDGELVVQAVFQDLTINPTLALPVKIVFFRITLIRLPKLLRTCIRTGQTWMVPREPQPFCRFVKEVLYKIRDEARETAAVKHKQAQPFERLGDKVERMTITWGPSDKNEDQNY